MYNLAGRSGGSSSSTPAIDWSKVFGIGVGGGKTFNSALISNILDLIGVQQPSRNVRSRRYWKRCRNVWTEDTGDILTFVINLV